MAPTFLTVVAAGLMGGGIAADITVMVIVAAVALALIAVFNGMRHLVSFCEMRRD